jgi:arylsulfatase A-like enzyme
MDWVATFLAAARVPAHPDYPLDGLSLRATLADPGAATDRELFWRMKHRSQRAVRSGSWKYLAMDGREYLFDLSRDARERANLARRHPARLAELRARYDAWARTMPPVPDDARVSLVYGEDDIPNPSG